MLLREIWDIFFELFIFRLFARARSASANKRKIKSEKNISHISRKKHALIGLSHDTISIPCICRLCCVFVLRILFKKIHTHFCRTTTKQQYLFSTNAKHLKHFQKITFDLIRFNDYLMELWWAFQTFLFKHCATWHEVERENKGGHLSFSALQEQHRRKSHICTQCKYEIFALRGKNMGFNCTF